MGRCLLDVDAKSKLQVQRITVGAERDVVHVVANGLAQARRVIAEGLQNVGRDMAVDTAEVSAATPADQGRSAGPRHRQLRERNIAGFPGGQSGGPYGEEVQEEQGG